MSTAQEGRGPRRCRRGVGAHRHVGPGVALVPLVRRQAEKGAPVSYRDLKQLLESGR